MSVLSFADDRSPSIVPAAPARSPSRGLSTVVGSGHPPTCPAKGHDQALGFSPMRRRRKNRTGCLGCALAAFGLPRAVGLSEGHPEAAPPVALASRWVRWTGCPVSGCLGRLGALYGHL